MKNDDKNPSDGMMFLNSNVQIMNMLMLLIKTTMMLMLLLMILVIVKMQLVSVMSYKPVFL